MPGGGPVLGGLRLYASTAPGWWPYHLVSMANGRLPPRARPNYYSILVDNGMFGYAKRGGMPRMEDWLSRLQRFIWDVERLRKPAEIIVVLPDWLNEPSVTLRVLDEYRGWARRICSRYKCLAVVHAKKHVLRSYSDWAGELVEAAERSGVELWGLAAPLKLNCSRYSARAGRRIIRRACQEAIASQVCRVARSRGLHCHGLGAHLGPEHLKRLAAAGVDSIDSSSWTRPVNTATARTAGWSAKTARERELFFAALLRHFLDHGVVLEGVDDKVRGILASIGGGVS